MTLLNPQRHVVPAAVLTQSKLVPITAVRLVTIDVPKINVTRPRQAKTIITKPNSPPSRHIHRSPSPKSSNFPPNVTAVKAPMVNAAKGGNPQHALKDKRVIDSGCSRHMTGNMSYLLDFKELNGRYVAFGGNPKGGKVSEKKNSVLFIDTECLVLSPEFKFLDENQVLLRVPRENNMYNVDLKNIVPSGDLTSILKPTSNGKRRNRNACFVCKSLDHLIKDCDYHAKKLAQTIARNHAKRGTHKQYAQMTLLNPQRHVVPATVLTQSKLVPITAVRLVTIDVPKINVTRPRQAKTIVTKPNSPPSRHIHRSPSPKSSNFPPNVTAVKAPMVNAAKGVQGKWEWKPKCPILDHVTYNTNASITLKMFDYNDALGRSKSVMAWVPKRN
nr:hypothetical protein [Tanacetum cinerariifolium]